MIDTNTATYDAASQPTTSPAMAVRPAAALPTLFRNRAWSLTDTGRPASPHFAYVAGLKVREAGEHDAGTRSAQARTVLEMAVECIHEAHRCVGDFEEVI
jgi:hypothetical protein